MLAQKWWWYGGGGGGGAVAVVAVAAATAAGILVVNISTHSWGIHYMYQPIEGSCAFISQQEAQWLQTRNE